MRARKGFVIPIEPRIVGGLSCLADSLLIASPCYLPILDLKYTQLRNVTILNETVPVLQPRRRICHTLVKAANEDRERTTMG